MSKADQAYLALDPTASGPLVIGHRGARNEAPENTLAGIRKAREQGCSWVEFDAKLSRDGVPILMHDDTLERTTNGKGAVRDHDYADLARLDAGDGEVIPRLEAVLALCMDLDLRVNIELKPCPGRAEETALRVIETTRAIWADDAADPLISSFDMQALDAAMKAAPNWPRAVLMDEDLPESEWKGRLERFAPVSFNIWDKLADEDRLQHYLAADLPILVFTVNNADRAKYLFDKGVSGIFCDSPAAMRQNIGMLTG